MALTQPTQEALAILAENEERSVTAAEVANDMKNSEFFRQNWDSLLIAAPNCLEILGNINLVAATPYGETTALSGTFKHLTNANYLRGALACISSQGSRSFGVARTNMTSIQLSSSSVHEQVRVIHKALANPKAPMAAILSRLGLLKETAQECHTAAKQIEESMNLWAEFVYELHEVCNNNSASVAEQKRRTEQQLTMAKEDEKFRVQQEADAKKLLDKMDEHLTDAKDSYKKALDSMPTGMDLVGGAILMGLSEAAGTALNTFAGCMNPVGSVGEASKGLSSLVKDLKAETKSTPTTTTTTTTTTSTNGNSGTTTATTTDLGGESGDTSQKQKAESKKKLLTSKLAATFIRRAKPKTDEVTNSNTKPEPTKQVTETTSSGSSGYGEYDLSGTFMADDPALGLAPSVAESVEVIKNIIVGLPTGINWGLVTSSDANKASELVIASYALSRMLKSFKPRKGGLASQLLVATVTETIGVADELEAEGAKSTQLSNWERPTRQSAVYKDWDERITRCSTNAVALDAASQTVPGGVGTRGISLTTPQQTPEEKIANMNYKQSIAEQTVKSATQKLTSTQETYKATLDTYRKTADNLKEVKETLQAARAEIAALDAKKLGLVEVKKILIQCISYLIELKDRIRKLVVFFGNLTAMINVCMTKQVEPFKRELEIYAQNNKTKADLYESYYRDIIFRMVLQILSSFSLYKDVASMYIDVDTQVIRPGLVVVDRLALVNTDPKISNDAFFDQQRRTLSEYNTSAEETVHKIVQAKQNEIIQSMEDRIKAIGKDLDRFPAQFKQPDQKALEAAQQGAGLITASAEAEAAQPTAMQAISSRRRGYKEVA